jgi:3-isopropylmalate dehydrogenase
MPFYLAPSATLNMIMIHLQRLGPEQGLLKIRKELGLYANLRPIMLFDELLDASSLKPEILKGTDILFFRELTGDVYFGEKKRSEDETPRPI